jgi:glycosyltransferase involved in cell wall biosynthesis
MTQTLIEELRYIMPSSLSVVIPVYNESESLSQTLPQVLEYCSVCGWQVILVNDGSTDNSLQIINQYSENDCVRVINHKVNRGYGGALKSGLSNAQTDFVVTIDADGQHVLSYIDKVLQTQIDQDADMVVGKRTGEVISKDYYRRFGKYLIRRLAMLLTTVTVNDLNSGFKMYRTNIVQIYLRLCPNSMAFSDVITLIFVNQRHKVIEHPIQVMERVGGHSKLGTMTAFETVLEIFHIIILFNPRSNIS